MGWTVTELAERVGLKQQTVSGWVTAGLVTPDVTGQGRRGHDIGLTGLMELIAVKELREAGFVNAQIKKAVTNLRALSGEEHPLATLVLLVMGSEIAWKRTDEAEEILISALKKPGQRIMVFPVGRHYLELVQALDPLRELQSTA